MFNFSKSKMSSDLKNKNDVQYKVICDWLRTIDNKLNKLARMNRVLIDEVQSSSPSGEPDVQDDDSGNTEPER